MLIHANSVFAATVPPESSFFSNHWLQALLVVAAYLVFCFWINRKQHTPPVAESVPLTSSPQAESVGCDLLLAYASQTGFARQLAEKTLESLQKSGVESRLLALDEVGIDLLASCQRALFIVSTTGEGDAPDNAAGFVQDVMRPDTALPRLECGVLALGDSSYTNFCGFGNRLYDWLRQTGAGFLFDLIEVDGDNAVALQRWQAELGLLTQIEQVGHWQLPDYQPWRLQQRLHLNPGSAGAPVYYLALTGSATDMAWQAGDIAEISPRNSTQAVQHWMQQMELPLKTVFDGQPLAELLAERLLPERDTAVEALRQLGIAALLAQLKHMPYREYSIASLPQDGRLELLVRQIRYPDGRLGLGAGWLTEYAQVGDDILLRIRENSNFHAQADAAPLIMIGNGTGMAGLRAHLKARVAAGLHRNWLLFGERNAAHDLYFADELRRWLAEGQLAQLDTTFSRDQEERIYVQDALRRNADMIKRWVRDENAAIYVCGGATNMAPAVHNVLLEIFGATGMQQLTTAGRYRRDIY